MTAMHTYRHLLLRLLPALLLLPLVSCRKAVERTVEKIRFEGVERIDVQNLSSVVATLGVDNGTSHRLRLDGATLTLRYDGTKIATATLTEPAEAPARTRSSVETRWRIRVGDPIALLVALRALREEDLTRFEADIEASGHGGPAPVNISRERVPLQKILNTFGITLEDLKKHIR